MRRVVVLGVIVLIVLVFVMVGCTKKEVISTTPAPTGKVVQPVGRSCEDSDEGIVAEKAGKVSGVINGEEYVYYDNCPVLSGAFLMEYYCENGNSRNQNLRCPSGTRCLGGACRKL